jgi:hypothetical protein
VLPDLRTAVEHGLCSFVFQLLIIQIHFVRTGKKELLATQIKRAEAEKQLAERVQLCDAMKQKK